MKYLLIISLVLITTNSVAQIPWIQIVEFGNSDCISEPIWAVETDKVDFEINGRFVSRTEDVLGRFEWGSTISICDTATNLSIEELWHWRKTESYPHLLKEGETEVEFDNRSLNEYQSSEAKVEIEYLEQGFLIDSKYWVDSVLQTPEQLRVSVLSDLPRSGRYEFQGDYFKQVTKLAGSKRREVPVHWVDTLCVGMEFSAEIITNEFPELSIKQEVQWGSCADSDNEAFSVWRDGNLELVIWARAREKYSAELIYRIEVYSPKHSYGKEISTNSTFNEISEQYPSIRLNIDSLTDEEYCFIEEENIYLYFDSASDKRIGSYDLRVNETASDIVNGDVKVKRIEL